MLCATMATHRSEHFEGDNREHSTRGELRSLYVLGAAAALVAALGGQAEATTEPASAGRVLLVTGTGGLGDEGFNDAGYEGAQRAVTELGVELDVVEPTELAEIEQQYQSAAASGDYLIIVGLGFEQGEPSKLAATDHPDQLFANIDAASENPNVQGVLFREEENAFLAGVLAAHLTTSDATLANPEKVIGIVLGVDIPQVRRYAVSYEAGARTVDPEIEVLDGVVGNFEDQGIARDLTLAQIAQGADVVYQVAGGAGLGVFSAAEEEQVYAIGEGLNQNAPPPGFHRGQHLQAHGSGRVRRDQQCG